MTHSIDLIIFGGTGDLSMRKLLPALFHLQRSQLLGAVNRIVATGRSGLDTKGFRTQAHGKLLEFVSDEDWDEAVWQCFSEKLSYLHIDAAEASDYQAMEKHLARDSADIRLFYLATLPSLYGNICQQLKAADAITATSRVVLEKPLGHDLASCHDINQQVADVFPEEAIFRIDHYLGKETVQNLLALRFGNPIFHPLWNNRHIDNVQITVAETIGVEGRGSYYAKVGALRDMVQNHLLQVLSLVAMEPPASLNATDVRNEKVKVLGCLESPNNDNIREQSVRGRYTAGTIDGAAVTGFLDEAGYQDSEQTETFVALKAKINNWRWAGVPFYLRTGKRMAQRYSEIVIEFKKHPFSLFDNDPNELSNKLVIRLQPEETILLHTLNKKPGLTQKLNLQPVELHLTDESADSQRSYDAYERLLLDAISGDQTLFMRRDEVETAWQWVDSIIAAWQSTDMKSCDYTAGSMGPTAATALTTRDGHSWYK